MKIADINIMLGQTELKSTYYSWPETKAPALPYLLWYFPSSDNFSADDQVYKRIEQLNIELYTQTKDFDTEQVVEAVLDAWNMVWERTEVYIESEHMYQVLYQMEVTIEYGE